MNLIVTERLILSHLALDDAPFIFELLNTPEWIQFIGDRGIKTLDDAKLYIASGPIKSYDQNGFGLFLVKLKTDDTPIGICGLIKRPSLEDVDIGFAFLSAYTGQGYATEAAAATLEYGKVNIGLKRIVAITNDDNVHSIRLLEKIGLRFERKIKFEAEAQELLLFATA
ncbi:MAG: GNAT family N-acetyltransferase [Chitinophagales bacterium]